MRQAKLFIAGEWLEDASRFAVVDEYSGKTTAARLLIQRFHG